MRSLLARLMILGSVGLPFSGAVAQVTPYATSSNSIPAQPSQPPQPVEPASQAERELQQLMQQLTVVGEQLIRNVRSPQAWQYQLQQADLLLHIASRSKGKDRNNFLRMAIETYHSAAVQSPETEKIAVERLTQLPGLIPQHFPNSELHSFAALQGLRAEHARQLARGGSNQARAQADLADRLWRFATTYPKATEATPALQEAAQLHTTLGKTEEARRCYLLLAENHAGKDAAREARAALRRLGALDGQTIDLKLPLLYPTGATGDQSLDLKTLHGKLVILYFWASDNAQAEAGFEALKRVTDQYRGRGLEVVCVGMDDDPARAKQFLAGRLIAGTHVVLKDGLKSTIAERYGLETLPEFFLLGREGRLLGHSLAPAQLEAAVAGHSPASARDR